MGITRLLPIPVSTGPSGSYATSISVTMDENYVLSVQLIDQDGNPLGSEQTVDLPLESVVVGGSYDSENQQLILTLDNGNTIEIPISGLISGLQAEITAQNPLSADLLADGQTNKVFTATEQTKLSGLEAVSGTNDGTNWTSLTIGDTTKAIPQGGGGNDWYGTQAEFDALPTKDVDTNYFISDKLDYNTELKNTPKLSRYATKREVNTKNAEQDAAISEKMGAQFMTQQEFNDLQTKKEGENYFIQGETVEVVVTFTDQTTATYNVVVD